jgi:succinate-acetate transporter protein
MPDTPVRGAAGDTLVSTDRMAMAHEARTTMPETRMATAPAGPVIADPGPLGLAGFAMTTMVLSVFNANIISDAKLEGVVLPLALFYGGLVQLLAGMWEFRKGNTFGATAFSSYGAFWLSYWAFVTFFAKDVPAANAGSAVGLYLIGWGIFTAYMWIASFRTTAAINLVFLLLAITYFLLGIGEATGSSGVGKLGGWVGLATAVAAWYASFAAVANFTFGRELVPVRQLRRA